MSLADRSRIAVGAAVVIFVVIGIMAGSSARAQSGPVAAYGFNEGNGNLVADASGNGNAGVAFGTSWVAGHNSAGALSFNGTSTSVRVRDSGSLDLTSAMTLEAWVYPRNLTSWRSVLMKERADNLVYALYASTETGRPSVEIKTGSNVSSFGSTKLPLNTWSHLAATYDGRTLRLYVNGIQAGSKAVTGSILASSHALWIGGNTVWGEHFNGLLDDIRIYNRTLTAANIVTDMNTPIGGTPPPDTTPPVRSGGQPTGTLAAGTTTTTLRVTTNEAATCKYATSPGIAYASMTGTFTTTTGLAHTAALTGLTNGTTYHYYVRCRDQAATPNTNTDDYAITFSVATPVDMTPPTVTATFPSNGATNVRIGDPVTATFSEAMNASTIGTATFELRNSGGTLVIASVSYTAATFTATLTPTGALSPSTTYTATVRGGSTDPRAKDLAGNALAANKIWSFTTEPASPPCTSPANPIVAENCRTGNPSSEWDVSGSGDSTIQGFATDISVNKGQTIHFKIDTTASAYRIDIYRLGYYSGLGARKVATVIPTQVGSQQTCLTDAATGLIDCGNWLESASWTVPSDAASGLYIARPVRTDNGGASHIPFVVRDDSRNSDVLFQTSDTTWQAYNNYGGNSLYTGSPAGRAYKVSYNRPLLTRSWSQGENGLFNAEYPMIRWLEANGYDVTYFTDVDTDRNGTLIPHRKVWMSNGHDEYWSGNQRAQVEAARAAGVHLVFFSGNTMFWKTRWESSIDGSGTPYRTLVCYKETHANAKTDPLPNVWTGTWRDPRFSPPADGGRPENALTGNLFRINGIYTNAISVRQEDGKMRFWRGTSVAALAPGATAVLAPGTLGAEVNVDEDNGFRPAGLFSLSTTPISTTTQYLLDYGNTYGAGATTHGLNMYRYSSGALVFTAGSFQWSWGLDANHDRSGLGSTTDASMQQATVNLLADMGAQPATLLSPLTTATPSTDAVAPSSTITQPAPGGSATSGGVVTISGTASDTGGGAVSGVEVSVDGGLTWHPAAGRASWTYGWTPSAAGSVTLKSRAVDDSGNLETPSAGVTVAVSGTVLWSATTVPSLVDSGDLLAVELGVKFRSSGSGYIRGVRFYKATSNLGPHVVNLWTSAGGLLATATSTPAGETASGWQQVNFSAPVAIAANTTYVASYFAASGHYSKDQDYFLNAGHVNGTLTALQDGVDGGNGVFFYGASGGFPSSTFGSTNYWVDVLFDTSGTLASP